MKKLLTVLLLLTAATAFAQDKKTDSLPYLRHPGLPAFQLLGLDSSTIFNTFYIPEGQPSVLMFFSPDCDHCEKETEKIIARMAELKKIRFYMVTPMSIPLTKAFYDKLHLEKYKNIIVYKDYEYFFPRFYKVEYVPCFAIYDKHKKFVKLMEGTLKIDEMLQLIH